MYENFSKKMNSKIKRGENLVKSVMLANGVRKPSRRAVILTTLASETFIAALTQDAVIFKSLNERLRVHHIIQALAGSSRYSFVKNVLYKFHVELHNDLSAFKTIGFNRITQIQRQMLQSQQFSCKDHLISDFISTFKTNQNEEADAEHKDDKPTEENGKNKN